ncbi:MAG: O-antigen ligase family protein [Anaerolineae bacterium]|nr:O-antigen ligase family protein [Anaerolineae bacterium]MCB9129440.1 O-antigen ligase family protein [Anaerolineales bacterium]MCB9143516.1 O-antigen ligase family protein [Anaerolineales bacterium]
MTTQATAPAPHSWHVAPRWVILILLALAGLAVLAYFQAVLAALLVVVAVVVVVAWVRPFWVFAGLLALLPFHEQVVRIVTWQLGWPASRITLLSLWKEGIIVLLAAVILVQHFSGRRRIRAKAYRFDLWLAALVLLAAAYILVAATISIGVYGFRNYFEPLAVFFLVRLMPFSRREMTRLLVLLTAVAVVVALFGIYQARFIDFPTMVSMGYLDEFGNLPFAFKTALQDGVPRPRAISTVTGPNQLAIYLNIFILLTGYALVRLRSGAFRSLARQAVLVVLLAIYVLCLLLTYSRGGLLALAVSLLGTGLIVIYERGVKRTWHELIHNRWLWLAMAAAAVAAVGGLVVTGFARRIWRGLTGQDPAALGHLTSLNDALGFLTYNPLGIGMGMAGPRALRFTLDAQIQHTESTYLQFGMELGLIGMALLLVVLLSLVATLWRIRQRQKASGDTGGTVLAEVALVTWLGALAVFAVTPLMQNFLVAAYLWLVAGLAFHLDAYRGAVGSDQ